MKTHRRAYDDWRLAFALEQMRGEHLAKATPQRIASPGDEPTEIAKQRANQIDNQS